MRCPIAGNFLAALLGVAAAAMAQSGPSGPPPSPKAAALIDVTGYWVSIVDEDWRWRMVTPPKGDFASVPLNAEGRKVGMQWDAVKDEAAGEQCKAYGAAGLLRLPTRVHITWADDQTLKLETDAGMQTRLFHFGPGNVPLAVDPPQWQGVSVASWEKERLVRGFAPVFGPPGAGKGGGLKLVTTRMRAGYLRKNGVPYSANARLTEFFDRIEVDGLSYLIVATVVDDPQYLSDTFITSEQFRLEADGSKWNPTPCKAK